MIVKRSFRNMLLSNIVARQCRIVCKFHIFSGSIFEKFDLHLLPDFVAGNEDDRLGLYSCIMSVLELHCLEWRWNKQCAPDTGKSVKISKSSRPSHLFYRVMQLNQAYASNSFQLKHGNSSTWHYSTKTFWRCGSRQIELASSLNLFKNRAWKAQCKFYFVKGMKSFDEENKSFGINYSRNSSEGTSQNRARRPIIIPAGREVTGR